MVASARAADPDCCAKDYEVACTEPEADTHWCTFVDDEYYAKVQIGGIITTIVLAAIMVLVVAARDIFKVWDCFGTTTSVVQKPDRQLTTMSAAYALETVQVPMGGYPGMGMPGMMPGMMMPGMMPGGMM